MGLEGFQQFRWSSLSPAEVACEVFNMFQMAIYGQLSITSRCDRVFRTALPEIQAGCLLQRAEHLRQIILLLHTESLSEQPTVML
jgi:hypothetical protein